MRTKNLKNRNSSEEIEELSETNIEIENDYAMFDFNGEEVLMGADINIDSARVEKQFSFNSSNVPVLNVDIKDEDSKKLNISIGEAVEENLTVKRSYTLRPSTVKMLQELKVFIYDDPYINYNDIVDAAIRLFYDYKKKGM
ncbi:MAG: hypothetical protein VB130_07085 [Clostridium sp.]|nr:hypothetical protein [Clostridium sp.]